EGFKHFMLKEIFEQPRAVARAMAPHVNVDKHTVNLFANTGLSAGLVQSIDRVMIVACGTSFYAGQVGKYLIEKIAGIAVDIDIASEFRYREPVLQKNTLAVVI